ncbi:hypothetical protein AB4120_14790 [Cupriavidus sp. 2KB_3]|uniref:hypothetical protein n=1 Tax=Cupriavidus sp. 2KB_3 TaxID=3232980 RepID=UPI003F9161A3
MNKPFLVAVTVVNLVAAAVSGGVHYAKQPFELRARSAISAIPVPSFRPASPGKVIALDVMPSAGAKCTDEGCAWVDVCDADVMHAKGDVPVGCARIAAKADRVEFGSRNFDGAAPRDIYIIRDGRAVARFDADGLTVFGKIREATSP